MKDLAEWVNKVHCGDCAEVLKELPSGSIDCIVTDPPYGISFMGKEWDKALPKKEAFMQMHRVLKAGGLAFVMSSPRQDVLWRMMQMLEECGFQLRQSFISWIYKTGFPKAYDVSLGIDIKFVREAFRKEHGRKPTRKELKKLMKEKRKVVGKTNRHNSRAFGKGEGDEQYGTYKGGVPDLTLPASDLAKKWQGWKSITGLKPALECILMVNKPLSERTIVDNVLKHGTGAMNVDACRIPIDPKTDDMLRTTKRKKRISSTWREGSGFSNPNNPLTGVRPEGRFPANLLVSDKALDTGKITKSAKSKKVHEAYGDKFKFGGGLSTLDNQYDDSGGASRFFDLDAWAKHHGFLDVAKPSKREKDKGLENLPEKDNLQGLDTRGRTLVREDGSETLVKRWKASGRNIHPTVKPIKLMAYLIELGCPPDGIVLDPFVGSGTTCIAAQRLNRKWIGIEINPEYVKIASARLGNVEIVITKKDKTTKSDKTVIKRKSTSGKPRCGYAGKCSYKTADGFCTSKRYCKDKEF